MLPGRKRIPPCAIEIQRFAHRRGKLADISLTSTMAIPPLDADYNRQASSLGEFNHNVPLQDARRGGLEGLN
uniref:Uncharacterized protein n=1 Tax=Salix viminalis TaxID=40686 RepID=A0A6N2KJL1_SALVM